VCGADQLQNKLIVGNDRRGGVGELKLDWIVYRPAVLAGKRLENWTKENMSA
jgi:hypothetical protein